MRRNKRKGGSTQNAGILCEGLRLDDRIYEEKEKRLWTLFLKGILAYLICAGTIGSVLTAAGTPYSAVTLHLVILTAAVGFSCMYYRKLTANIGGLLLLVFLIFLVFWLGRYINSGFYAVLNDLNDHAATYFGLSGVRVFTERMNNRRAAATISMSFLGIIASMVLNMLFMYRMRYLCAAFLSLPFLLFPVYIGREPSLLYVGMLLTGLLAAFAWKRAGHYEKVDSDSVYGLDKQKNLSRIYHKGALLGFLGQVVAWVLILVLAVAVLNPKEAYLEKQKISDLKLRSKNTVENIVLLGLSGFFNRYENTGGMNSGRLGGVGTVNLDYNTDLKLRITPYSYETIYLKYFTGGEYLPYDNMWARAAEGQNHVCEAQQLRHGFENGRKNGAKGKLEIENVAALLGTYLPYYSEDTQTMGYYGETMEYTYYPRLSDNRTPIEQEIDMDYWLAVPEANYDTIAAFCAQAGFGGSQEEIIRQVKEYYQREIPYTLRPGSTPRREDFINYFLNNNRKGYCTHFASAAVLIFRYYGIPARYVEGYAVSYDQILEGTLVDGAVYDEYYEGFSELGETALVEVELTDADAHAWVEVYDEKNGWEVVEVTPYSTEEMQGIDFWSMFLNLWGKEAPEDEETAEGGNAAPKAFDMAPLRTAVLTAIVFFIAAMAVFLLTRLLLWRIRYYRADRNDRLILLYKRYLHKKKRKYQALGEKQNYREQILYLTEGRKLEEAEKETLISILEKAGFSNHRITPEEFEAVRTKLFL